ncbi:MAG: molybdopterin molybdotransferase MoeA, partial [Asticcacaulis sp.]
MSRKLFDVSEAIGLVRAGVPEAAAEIVSLSEASGRVLAKPVVAPRDQPPFGSSAMDGYAVRREDIKAGATLTVVGESMAGRRFAGSVNSGEAVRIFTGAPVPDGASAVVIQENVAARDGRIDLLADAETGSNHIRRAGQDFTAGTVLLEAGVRLDAWRLSLAAAAGSATVHVRRKPRVAVLCNGDELVPPGASPGPDQIHESASAAVMALITQWGAEAAFIGSEGDHAEAL